MRPSFPATTDVVGPAVPDLLFIDLQQDEIEQVVHMQDVANLFPSPPKPM